MSENENEMRERSQRVRERELSEGGKSESEASCVRGGGERVSTERVRERMRESE